MDIYQPSADRSEFIIARYRLRSRTTVWDAAYNIAVGQSIGNPKIRNAWETDELYHAHLCKILSFAGPSDASEGEVEIGFPARNLRWPEDGVSQLLCFLMGGHLDIDLIESCQLVDVDLSPLPGLAPKLGISGLRALTGVYGKPLLGGIVKPKTGLNPQQLLAVVRELVEGGVNFIKEDEILGDPACCPLQARVETIQPYLSGKKVVYCYCVNGDYPHCVDRARSVAAAGGNGVHANVWGGLGVYKTLRELDLPLAIHFQKSGDKIFTSTRHAHHMHWNVVCKLAVLMGVDTIHAGMWGGYSNCSEDELRQSLAILRQGNVMPALSCGMHPGIVNNVTELFGPEYIANVGGAIHGHPGGTRAGVLAMRQAIDGTFGPEYAQAVAMWGSA